MPLDRFGAGCAKVGILGAAFIAGCSSAARQATVTLRDPVPRAPQVELLAENAPAKRSLRSSKPGSRTVTTVSHEELADDLTLPAGGGEELFAGQSVLSLPELV